MMPLTQMKRLRRRMADILPLPKLASMTDEEVERHLYKLTLNIRVQVINNLPIELLRDEAKGISE